MRAPANAGVCASACGPRRFGSPAGPRGPRPRLGRPAWRPDPRETCGRARADGTGGAV